MLAAGIERRRLQGGQKLRQSTDRVFGALRIGGVALASLHGERRRKTAAAADLDLIPDAGRRCRLAHDGGGKALAATGGPVEDLYGTVDGGPLLVPGHQNRKAAAEVFAAAAHEAKRSGNHGGEAALHVHRAAAVEHAV